MSGISSWFSGFTISDGLIILATVVGPIAAVQAQKWIERSRERANRRRGCRVILSPSQLKLFSLRDLKPGTLATLVGREDDVPVFLRLAEQEAGQNPVIMPLDGEYAFQAIPWSVNDYSRILCSPEELHFRIQTPSATANLRGAGFLTLHDKGACTGRAPVRGSLGASPIDVSTWLPLPSSNGQEALQSFSEWEIGRISTNGDFQSLYKRSSIKK